MSVIATAHLNFQGQARQALNFYQSVFGGQAMLVTYQQAASAHHPADAHHIAYGQVESDNGFRIMAYDVAVGTPWQPGENAYSSRCAARPLRRLQISGTNSRPARPSCMRWPPRIGRPCTACSRTGLAWSGCWMYVSTTLPPEVHPALVSWFQRAMTNYG